MKKYLSTFIVAAGIAAVSLTGQFAGAQSLLNLQQAKTNSAGQRTRGAAACVPHYTHTLAVNSYFTDVYFENNSNISTNSEHNDTSYQNLFAEGTDLPAYRGGAININFTVDTNNTENVAVWLDQNNDLTFQSSEKGGELDNIAPGGAGSFSITIPENTPLGPHILRVRLATGSFNNNIDPCTTYTDGDCIDIGINICGDLSPYCEPMGEALGRSLEVGHFGLTQIAVGDSVFKIDTLSACFDYLDKSPVVLQPGGFYSIHSTFGTGNPVGSGEDTIVAIADTIVAIAWIDYDNDGVFSNGEMVGDTVRFTAPNQTVVSTFTLPNNILGYRRMRVAIALESTDDNTISTYSNPCPVFNIVSGRDILLDITTNAGVDNLSAIQQSMQVINNPGSNGNSRLVFNTAAGTSGNIVITDVSGRELQNTSFSTASGQVKQTLQVAGISAGIYFVNVEQNGKIAACKKWVVE